MKLKLKILVIHMLLVSSTASADPLPLQTGTPTAGSNEPGAIAELMATVQQIIDGLLELVFHSTGGLLKLGLLILFGFIVLSGIKYGMGLIEDSKRRKGVAAREAREAARLAARLAKNNQELAVASSLIPILNSVHGHTVASNVKLSPDGQGGIDWSYDQTNSAGDTTVEKGKKIAK